MKSQWGKETSEYARTSLGKVYAILKENQQFWGCLPLWRSINNFRGIWRQERRQDQRTIEFSGLYYPMLPRDAEFQQRCFWVPLRWGWGWVLGQRDSDASAPLHSIHIWTPGKTSSWIGDNCWKIWWPKLLVKYLTDLNQGMKGLAKVKHKSSNTTKIAIRSPGSGPVLFPLHNLMWGSSQN